MGLPGEWEEEKGVETLILPDFDEADADEAEVAEAEQIALPDDDGDDF